MAGSNKSDRSQGTTRRDFLKASTVATSAAVAGTLGRSAAGLVLLQQQRPELGPELVAAQRRPQPPLAEGPLAAVARARGMLDISDGLLRDGSRVASASAIAVTSQAAQVSALMPARLSRQRSGGA